TEARGCRVTLAVSPRQFAEQSEPWRNSDYLSAFRRVALDGTPSIGCRYRQISPRSISRGGAICYWNQQRMVKSLIRNSATQRTGPHSQEGKRPSAGRAPDLPQEWRTPSRRRVHQTKTRSMTRPPTTVRANTRAARAGTWLRLHPPLAAHRPKLPG